ncbi:D-arabinono-1,4-lactone oxidase [Promicromonospora thailandica]|uniref:FAD-linked oxidoreductase n=1 Tax=Promicromonospora thailandica TaxID=765201 RepID=A0A9X2G6E3_9MICO|nr:D-arabinono-1,4-lactone oxidase [Promicromonospora thailandica]MCP2266495.1 FAD-linked oxidoreductase [Promicromonospora thailandica]
MIWTNWARTASATPVRQVRPATEEELSDAVRQAVRDGLTVRPVGAGHSFSAAAATDGVQVDLERLTALHRVERDPATGNALVTVGAGIRLHQLNRLLAERGLAMQNLGDIDRQSIAGAVSTGTHGTGARFGGLATRVRALTVVGADGEVRHCSPTENADLFEASRLGLGTTGVLSTVTVEAVPAFDLRATEDVQPLDHVLGHLDQLVDEADHFEFFWFPTARRVQTLTNTRVAPRAEHGRPARAGRRVLGAAGAVRTFVHEEVLSNAGLELVNRTATAFPATTPTLNRFAAQALRPRTYTAPSHEVLCNPRRVRFRETEYAVPRAVVVDVLRELDGWLRRTGENVPFPLEIRFAPAEDVWLSTAHGRETAYVAVQQYWRLPYGRYFDAAEQIFGAVGGRPHWGKMHTRDAGYLAGQYPRFEDFRRTRDAADPDRVFSNAYTRRVLG